MKSETDDEVERRKLKHRIYGHRITVVIIFSCSILFLGGMWLSGLDLDKLVEGPKLFSSDHDICLRTITVGFTDGEGDGAELCTEWLDRTDMSGKTHVLAPDDVELVKGEDGHIRVRIKTVVNYPLLSMSAFLIGIIIGGRWVQRVLIQRYKRQLGLIS